MKFSLLICAGFLASSSAETLHLESRADWIVGQTVQTSSGPVSGKASSDKTEVSEYLGIPFAKPPVGDLRFAPPEKYEGTSPIDGTKFSPSCPGTIRTDFTDESFAANHVSAAGAVFLQAFAQLGDNYSEDCLTINVWTKPQAGEAKKAVLVWVYGGGFVVGNSDNLGYNGQYIVDREDVIIVTFNYRLNIFGFPGSPSTANNLGLLDQRLALEWVRDNIEAFGGDTSRITLFGQSAGGASVDYWTFAWTEDPIVSAFIPQSGTAVSLGQLKANESAALWYTISATLGCGDANSNSDTVLACMRDVPDFSSFIKAIANSTTNSVTNGGSFGPTIDEKVVFSDYNARGLAGKFIQAPVLIGVTDYEGGFFQLIAEIDGTPLPDSVWTGVFQDFFNCGTALRANISLYHNLPVWRYRWFGTYPNTDLSTTKSYGAYHASEISIIFGIPPFGPGVPANTPAEIEMMKYMTGAWAAFAKDPVAGLTNYGWPAYRPADQTLARLAFQNSTGLSLTKGTFYDSTCPTIFPAAGNGTAAGNGSYPANPSYKPGGTGSPTTYSTGAPTSSIVPVATSGGKRGLASFSLIPSLLFALLAFGF